MANNVELKLGVPGSGITKEPKGVNVHLGFPLGTGFEHRLFFQSKIISISIESYLNTRF